VLTPTAIEERASLNDFSQRVSQYVRLHRRLERTLPPEQLFKDLEEMPEAVAELHDALVQARPNAEPGSIFTPAVADLLTMRLARAIATSGLTPTEVVIAMNLGYRSEIPKVRVNDRFPAVRYALMWPVLLDALPALPEELEYRVVYRDLVLVDVHADLVVDILENALPSPFDGLVRDSAPPRKSPQARRDTGV
jgi:hypothetical protein